MKIPVWIKSEYVIISTPSFLSSGGFVPPKRVGRLLRVLTFLIVIVSQSYSNQQLNYDVNPFGKYKIL